MAPGQTEGFRGECDWEARANFIDTKGTLPLPTCTLTVHLQSIGPAVQTPPLGLREKGREKQQQQRGLGESAPPFDIITDIDMAASSAKAWFARLSDEEVSLEAALEFWRFGDAYSIALFLFHDLSMRSTVSLYLAKTVHLPAVDWGNTYPSVILACSFIPLMQFNVVNSRLISCMPV